MTLHQYITAAAGHRLTGGPLTGPQLVRFDHIRQLDLPRVQGLAVVAQGLAVV